MNARKTLAALTVAALLVGCASTMTMPTSSAYTPATPLLSTKAATGGKPDADGYRACIEQARKTAHDLHQGAVVQEKVYQYGVTAAAHLVGSIAPGSQLLSTIVAGGAQQIVQGKLAPVAHMNQAIQICARKHNMPY